MVAEGEEGGEEEKVVEEVWEVGAAQGQDLVIPQKRSLHLRAN